MTSGRRRNIRLRNYDYSEPGIYYVTFTLNDRRPLFGDVTSNGVHLSAAGEMIAQQWKSLPERFPWVTIDDYVVMPDHVHGLIVFGADPDIDERATLGSVIGAFKSLTTLAYGKGVRELGWSRFNGTLWLGNYYERVVRNDRELTAIRTYIAENPYRWFDKYGK